MRWPHYKHVFFDCDSTLSTVEGIDILAERSGKKADIEALTNAAMNGQVDLADVYAQRLAVVQPTKGDINAIRQAYKRHIVADARRVIDVLKALDINVYIISGGLYEPVAEFGVHLGVPRDRIRAVGVEYNQLSGQWWLNGTVPRHTAHYLDYANGPLTVSDGKADIVRELLGDQGGRSLLIGDGSSDLRAGSAVDLFVGFGGVVSRQYVADHAPVFIHSPSLAPLLSLACGPGLLESLRQTAHAPIIDKANTLIREGAVTFNDEQLNQKFLEAHSSVYSRPH
jgi:phosphoserine phosphatase